MARKASAPGELRLQPALPPLQFPPEIPVRAGHQQVSPTIPRDRYHRAGIKARGSKTACRDEPVPFPPVELYPALFPGQDLRLSVPIGIQRG